jgi:hypothetical protein
VHYYISVARLLIFGLPTMTKDAIMAPNPAGNDWVEQSARYIGHSAKRDPKMKESRGICHLPLAGFSCIKPRLMSSRYSPSSHSFCSRQVTPRIDTLHTRSFTSHLSNDSFIAPYFA